MDTSHERRRNGNFNVKTTFKPLQTALQPISIHSSQTNSTAMNHILFAALAFQGAFSHTDESLLLEAPTSLPNLMFVDTVGAAEHHGCKYAFNPTKGPTRYLDWVHFTYMEAGTHGMYTLTAPIQGEFSIQTRKACKPRILVDGKVMGAVKEDQGIFARYTKNEFYDTTYVGEWFTGFENFLTQTNLRTAPQRVSLYLPLVEDGERCHYILEHLSMVFYARGQVQCQEQMTHNGVYYN